MGEDASVYAICDDIGNCKIGSCAGEPGARLRALQTGNPRKLEVVISLAFGSRVAAYRVEAEIHRSLRHHLVRSEWFEATPDVICRYLLSLVDRWCRDAAGQ